MNKELRIVFMGTPEFAVASLDALYKASFHIVGVITTADKKAGRGKKLQESAVKKYAIKKQIPVLTPLNLKDPQFLDVLKKWNANLQVVVAFRMLPAIVWQAPKYGTFNLHASLLPQYRGAAPINHAIINGEKESGVSTFFLDQEIDTGRIIEQKKCSISETDSAGDLHDKLMEMGAGLVVETVKAIANNTVKTQNQEELLGDKNIKLAPKIFKADGQIQWNHSAKDIYNKIRGLSPYPSAWTMIKNSHKNTEMSLKIFASSITKNENGLPGHIKTDGKSYLSIQTSDYLLEIKELQLQGKKRMKTIDFLRGFPISKDWICV